MRLILQNFFLCLFAFGSVTLFAQPANDDCANAVQLTLGADEASAIRVAGDTRGGTASTAPTSVCSGSWFGDDVWYTVSLPQMLDPTQNFVVKTYFNSGVGTDVLAVGIGVYTSCDPDAVPFYCTSTADPTVNTSSTAGGICLPSGDFYIRIWSGGSATDNSGTFEIAAYVEDGEVNTDVVLWEEDFDGGIGDWTTAGLGLCRLNPDSSVNAVFEWIPDGAINRGAYTNALVVSPTYCNGSMGVDSDYNDNLGDNTAAGVNTGPVPTANGAANTADYILQSPAIYTNDFDVPGLTLTFNYSVRDFNQAQFFAGWRFRNTADTAWTAWTNAEFEESLGANNSADDVGRFFMSGATDFDSLQVRFLYVANYYYMAVDDVKIIETESNNLRVQSNFFAIAPWSSIPASQKFDYPVLTDIYNAGAITQTNVVLNHTVEDGNGTVVSNLNLNYGSIEADSIAQNKLFPDLVSLPDGLGTYTGQYTLSSDSTDFDPSDNSVSYGFDVSSNTYSYDADMNSQISPAASNYDEGAPLGYTYGLHYYVPNGSTSFLSYVEWAPADPVTVAGKTINIFLYKWIDVNENKNVENGDDPETEIVGFAEYTFTGDEVPNEIMQTILDNFNNPGTKIFLEDKTDYLVMIEYPADDQASFSLTASRIVDYSAAVLASDSAFVRGLTDHRDYVTALGLEMDGSTSGIDFGIGGGQTFGDDIVPVLRMVLDIEVGTNDPLPTNNLISMYPNPTTELITVDLEFAQNHDNIMINLLDLNGRNITQRILSNVQQQRETFNVSSLAAGTYMIQVITDEGQRSQTFVVQK